MAVIACDFSGERSNGVKITAEQRAKIEQVGVLHNEGLDFIIADLMAEKVRLFEESAGDPATRSSSGTGFPAAFDFEQFAISSTEKFMKTIAPELDEDFLDAVLSSPKTRSLTRSSAAERDAEVMEILTPFQQEYWRRMLDIVYREDMNPVLLRKELAKLEKRIVRDAPTVEQAEQLLYATSVAVNSAEYWTENLNKWNTVLNSQIVRIIDPSEDLAKELMESVATRSGGGVLEQLPQGWYPVPGDPEWYIYVDSEGTIYLLPCPDGLVWRQDMCTCWWPENIWEKYPNSHSSPPPFEYSVAELLLADAEGAASGAIAGIPGGVFGMTAGALIVSTHSSAANALMQHLLRP